MVILFSNVLILPSSDLRFLFISTFLILLVSRSVSASANCWVKSVFLNSRNTALTSFISSFADLYKSSNIKLLIPQVTEAGPGNIVPTSSTIVQLSLGDALAVATMKYRNFGKLDFKFLKDTKSKSFTRAQRSTCA